MSTSSPDSLRSLVSRFAAAALFAAGLSGILPGIAAAVMPKGKPEALDALAVRSERLNLGGGIDSIDALSSALGASTNDSWNQFRAQHGDWTASVDSRNGLIASADGAGIPWIPGRGNRLTKADLASVLGGRAKPDLGVLESIARNFIAKNGKLLKVDPSSLVLNPGRSGQPADYLWNVDFDIVRGGIPVENARIVFRVNHGNLIQWGTEYVPTADAILPSVKLSAKDALEVLSKYVGGLSPATDKIIENGNLHLVPTSRQGTGFGNGYELANVYQFTFYRQGVLGTWRAKIDAGTGEILEFVDANDYAQATGGIYQNSPTTGAEVVRPLPYANLSTGGATNSAGLFAGGSPTSTLVGPFVGISDTCGATSLGVDASGNLAFGTSSGTDCTTPGVGGAGNTHASREQFYQLNRIKEVAKGWLPSNVWLGQQLWANVNLNDVCNASWNGWSVNFFRSGSGCANTGEIAGISLHEFGHGLDLNDGTYSSESEKGTGEAYGDVTAMIALHDSCIGPGFSADKCDKFGDACTSCTGVRDIDFAKHASNTAFTVSNFTQVRCEVDSSYPGPCGRQAHCESQVPSQAIWDFANRDLPGPGLGPAWTTLDRLWYLSRSTATSSFTCTPGATFTSNGCNAGSWWKTMRFVDDDDGNLANGTPHGGALFAAFNRHGIACTTDAGASVSFSGCTPPVTPNLTLAGASNSATAFWNSSGPGVVYDVFRNETGCNSGFTRVANDVTGTTYVDSAVANGTTYFYQVIAHPPGNEACGGPPTTCRSVAVAPFVGKILSPVDYLCMDTSNYGASTGSALEMQACLENAGQFWEYDSTAKTIRSTRNNQCIKSTGIAGSQVTLDACANDPTQKWVLDTNRRFSSVADPGKCLDVEGASVLSGAKVILYGCHSGANQKWYPEAIANGQRRYDPNTGAVYLVDRGLLRHVPDPATLNRLFRDWLGFINIGNVSDYLIGTAISPQAYLAREVDKAEVYLVENNKRHITGEVIMDKYNFDWEEIRVLLSGALSGVPIGDPIR